MELVSGIPSTTRSNCRRHWPARCSSRQRKRYTHGCGNSFDIRNPVAGPSASALRAASIGSAVAGLSSSTRAHKASEAHSRDTSAAGPSESIVLAPAGTTGAQLIRQVEDAMNSPTVDNDETLQLALGFRRNDLTTDAGEFDRAAITRLAIQFLDLARPRASARDALIGLARAGWDLKPLTTGTPIMATALGN